MSYEQHCERVRALQQMERLALELVTGPTPLRPDVELWEDLRGRVRRAARVRDQVLDAAQAAQRG